MGGIISRSSGDAQRTPTTLTAERKGEICKYRNNESNGLKRVNTEDELNLALRVMLRDYIALNAPEEMQRNFILQSKKIVDASFKFLEEGKIRKKVAP